MTQAFDHLAAQNADLYRALLGIFVAAKEHYRLHLRPEEVRAALPPEQRLDELPMHNALRQLVDWGNLHATHDSSEVRTVEEFNRARFLYQLSREGEAAEEALRLFYERIADPGALQTAALCDIEEHMRALMRLLTGPDDPGRVHQALSQLFTRFDGLAEQARIFLASLRRSLDLRSGGLDELLRYKEHLLGYVERFLRELTVRSGAIVEALDALEEQTIDAWLVRAAERELSDRLRQDTEARAREQARWQGRWRGLRSWFVGGDGRPPQFAELRAHTRSAVSALLQALGGLHDAQLRRSDRVADLRCLARWFATCEDDQQAHTLYQQAFLLAPGRHLALTSASLDERAAAPVPPSTSWLTAPPMILAPQLRKAGRVRVGPGKPAVVLHNALEKAELQRRLATEAAALNRARAAIACGKVRKLSELQIHDPLAFDLLLDCLGAVLSEGLSSGQSIDTVSGDGSLRIHCTPLLELDAIRLVVPGGELHGPELELCIEEAW